MRAAMRAISSLGGSTPEPGTPTPGTQVPGTPAPGAPTPGTPAPGSPAPGRQDPATPTPGTPAPGTPAPGAPAPGAPAPGAPAPGAPAPGTPGPDLGGRRDYPETGPYRLTSISPTRVSASGGTTVTVTGAAIPAGATVRVGTSTSALVVGTTTSSRLAFRTPALVPGSYDVYVFGPDRSTHSVLVGGLTYVAEEGTGGAPQPGTPTPGAPQPGTPTPGAPQPGTPAPGAPQPGTQAPGTPPSGSAPEVTGPNGERLRHSVRFASLGSSIWGVDCSSSCSGLAV